MFKRPNWHNYFMEIAKVVSSRGTCNRAQVGCVLVKDNRIIATGYNGSLPSREHCDDTIHYLVDGHCIRTNHAELNALATAAKNGISSDGAVAYLTITPCLTCARQLIASGILYIIYEKTYPGKDFNTIEDL